MSEFGRISKLGLDEPSVVGTITLGTVAGGTSASGAWPAANRALFIPFRLAEPATGYKLVTGTGSTAGNNIDMGIYDQWGNRLYSSGAIARPAAAEIVHALSSPLLLGRGRYYLGLAHNSTNNMMMQTMGSIGQGRLVGMLQMDSAYLLPATATFTAVTSAVGIPSIGLYLRRQ